MVPILQGGKPVLITEGSYEPVNHLSDKGNFYKFRCDLMFSVSVLGAGTHVFHVFMYPAGPGGQSLVNATKPSRDVSLVFSRASHNCPASLIDDFLCGKPTTCNCTLEAYGRPRGYAQWFKNGIPNPGPLTITYDSNEPEHEYTCEAVSALGGAHWTTLKYIRPKRPELESFESRLSTFWNWPVNFLTKEEIAQAGFYYTGDSDCTRCYYCGGAVRNWRPEDDIWLEHVRWFPCCPLMEDTFSKQLIDIVCDMHKNREKITRSTVNREVQRLGLQLDKDKSNQEEDMDTSKD